MAVDDRLANELWGEVFEYLPRDVLMALHSSHRLFHRISRSFLFREFRFHPYSIPDNAGQAEQTDPVQQRLRFWCSAEIAPCIRVCIVSPRDYPNHPNTYGLPRVDDPRNTLSAFFHSLPFFTNLRDFRAYAIHFSSIATLNLRLLPNLAQLDVRLCTVAEGVDCAGYAPLNLSACKFLNPPSIEDPWLPVLSPDTLRRLDMSCTAQLLSHLQQRGPLRGVRSLTLAIDFATIPQTLQVIAGFPALEVLTIAENREIDEFIMGLLDISHLFPNIREYTGPPLLLDVVLPISALRRLTLHRAPPSKVLATFQHSPHVMSLCINLTGFSNITLDNLCGFLPNVTELQIIIRSSRDPVTADDTDRTWKPEEFFKNLLSQSPLPTGLRKFAIHWKWSDRWRDATHVFELLQMAQEALLSRHPGISCIWIEGTRFLYFWRKGYGEAQYTYFNDQFPVDPEWQLRWDARL
ncbi:hypothetical protein DFH07DRAFT_1000701 [Mycena maculata]|uniref:F-box domain-containing protein n=1 Tax=Mycena maculata TaxID=230809 RepID=A0AAD7MPV1_9AGAR|nr:hypothetical protein DFH07DRAFT_1000701 [Mycena maculata]